jgi:iron complex outermembrane recepter protein
VSFEDRIDSADLQADALSSPAMVDRVVRDPTSALRAQICDSSQYQGDPAECLSLPISAVVDLRLRNIDILKTRGIDLLAHSDQYTPIGELGLRLEGTYLLSYSEASGRDAPLISLLNTATNPINVRLRASATWSRRNWSVTTALIFANSYRDPASVPSRRINSWTTADLSLGYALRKPMAATQPKAQLFLKIENLFNRYPPFVNNQLQYIGYDQENGDLLGRFASIGVRVNF